MSLTARRVFGRTHASRFFFGALLLLILILTRWSWIDCDGGTPSLMEYGYFATDEGYYTGGGKQKLLFGRFVNATRASPCTYAICPSSHLLAWYAFSLFGQTTWAHRVFPMLINTLAWLCLFYFLSRRTPSWIAFALCACCLLTPFLTVYGRTACNDTLMASVLLIGYVITRKKGLVRPFLGGCFFGLGLWVKQSIWILFLLGLGGAAIDASPRERLRRMAVFALGFIVSACVQYGLIRLLIHEDAASQNVSIEQLLKVSNSSYPLPNLFDWASTFKGISSFPRCPSDGLLGIWIPLFLVLPSLLLLRRLTDKPIRWDGRLLLYLTLPLYTAGIMVLPVFYAHYYIPVIAFVPIVWLEARHDMKYWAKHNSPVSLILMAVSILAVMLSFRSFTVDAGEADNIRAFLSNAYNLPEKIVWTHNGLHILAAAGLLALFGVWMHRRALRPWVVAGLLLSALGVADLCFVQLPLSEAYKFTPIFSPVINDVASVLQVGSIVLFFVVWGLPGLLSRNVRWPLFFVAVFICGTLANPVWRKGACELTHKGYLHKQAISELAKLIPDNAVVFGERAPQLFLSLKARVAAVPNGDPVPTVLAVHRKYPTRPLFALIDSEHNYHYAHYERNKDIIKMQVLHTLKLPSFNTGQPSDVFLLRLLVADSAAGPSSFPR